jgi:hypothetical protein
VAILTSGSSMTVIKLRAEASEGKQVFKSPGFPLSACVPGLLQNLVFSWGRGRRWYSREFSTDTRTHRHTHKPTQQASAQCQPQSWSFSGLWGSLLQHLPRAGAKQATAFLNLGQRRMEPWAAEPAVWSWEDERTLLSL